VGHASSYYFGKSPPALTIRESAFLASMLPGPKVYNPYRKLDRVMRRSDRILRRMYAAKMIGEEEFKVALADSPNIAGLERKVEKTLAAPPPEEKAPAAIPEIGQAQSGPPEGKADAPVPEPAPDIPEQAPGSEAPDGSETKIPTDR
jgi:monofunctional biosynthetic peptidoglycan transglycosylase